MTAVENKKPDVRGLVTKANYNTKIIESKTNNRNHDKYITTTEFNNLAAGVLVTKSDFDTKHQELNKKNNSNKTKHLLVETELKKLEKFDAAYFRGKNYFDDDGVQNYLVSQPRYRYFKTFTENNFIFISSWESKGMSNKKIGLTKTSNYEQSPRIVYDNARIKLDFSGDLFKQDKITYSHGPIVNIDVVYKLTPLVSDSGVT